MKNRECMVHVLQYIEEHLYEDIRLTDIALHVSYSPYHLHRMFTSMYQMSLHLYIQRRRLSEGAAMLIETDKPIIEIAHASGYHSQQSFHDAFKKLYHQSPRTFRRKKKLYRMQKRIEPLAVDDIEEGFNVQVIQMEELHLLGYGADIHKNVFMIGRCHHKLEKKCRQKTHALDYTYGVNDYRMMSMEDTDTTFHYFAGIATNERVEGMQERIIPATRFLCLTLYGDPKDSIQPVAEQMYHDILPNSTFPLNDEVMLDLIQYRTYPEKDGSYRICFMSAIK